MSLHTVGNPPPSGDIGVMVPVVLMTGDTGMVIVVGAFAKVVVVVLPVMDVDAAPPGVADINRIEPTVPPDTDIDGSGTAAVPGTI